MSEMQPITPEPSKRAEEKARERLNTISVDWHKVEGFKETETDVIRFTGDPTQVGKPRLKCDRIGIIALSAAEIRKQITDHGWNVGVARWATDDPNNAYVGSIGAADQLSTQYRLLKPGESADSLSRNSNEISVQAVGARICDGPLNMAYVGVDDHNIPHGVRGTEQVTSIRAINMSATLKDVPVV